MHHNSHSEKESESLIQGYLEGTLTEEESLELLAMLEQDPSLGKDIVESLKMDILLGETIKEKIEQPAEVPAAPVSSLFKYLLSAISSIHINTSSAKFWLVSAAIHTALLVIAILLVFSISESDKDDPQIEMKIKPVQGNGYSQTPKRGLKDREISDPDPALTEKDQDLAAEEVYELITPEDIERTHESEHLKEIVPIIDLNTGAWIEQIGVTDDIASAFRNRAGIERKRMLLQFGGSQASESAVLRALKWFTRHQSADGSWSLYHYFDECARKDSCKHLDEFGRADNKHYQQGERNCATSLALLSYLGAGHTHKAGKFRQQVANGLAFLKKNQNKDGSFCLIGYQHAIATMAMAEAYGMTQDPILREAAQKAVNFTLSQQNEDGKLGWDYVGPTARNDISVSGWQVMALKSAKSSGLEIGNSFEGVKNFLEKVTPPVQGKGAKAVLADDVSYAYNSVKDKASSGNIRLSAVGMLCRIFIGEDTKGDMLKAHANRQFTDLPSENTLDFYRWYYATLAMFQMGGDYWKKWNEAMQRVLLHTQSKGGCADGSWDASNAPHGKSGGRVFTTAIGCLSLEVYYRYLPVAALK
ncbi:prenyltransferase/squalene oxidase repeat-containing protein [Planctomycetota bacterium]